MGGKIRRGSKKYPAALSTRKFPFSPLQALNSHSLACARRAVSIAKSRPPFCPAPPFSPLLAPSTARAKSTTTPRLPHTATPPSPHRRLHGLPLPLPVLSTPPDPGLILDFTAGSWSPPLIPATGKELAVDSPSRPRFPAVGKELGFSSLSHPRVTVAGEELAAASSSCPRPPPSEPDKAAVAASASTTSSEPRPPLTNFLHGRPTHQDIRSEQGKKNRKSQKVLHRSGSKSHARVTTELHKEKGYPPRRDEVFVRTHMGKDGTVLNEETTKVLKDIDDAMEEHLELLEKSIQQGDILSHVLGKERNGYVRCIGLGVTASTLGIPRAQKLKSTKLQMAELEVAKAREANELLRNDIEEIGVDTKAQIDAMMEEMAKMRRMLPQYIPGNNIVMHTSEIQPEASVAEYSTSDNSLHDDHNIDEEDVVMQ